MQSGNFGPERNKGTCLVGEECGNLWRVRRDVGTSGEGGPDTEICRLGRQGIFVDFTLGHM